MARLVLVTAPAAPAAGRRVPLVPRVSQLVVEVPLRRQFLAACPRRSRWCPRLRLGASEMRVPLLLRVLRVLLPVPQLGEPQQLGVPLTR